MNKNVFDISEMTNSRELLESQPKKFSFSILYIFITILIIFFVWSYYGKIDIYINVPGIVRPVEAIADINNIAAGKVKTANMSDGSYVNQGDVLLVIENNDENDKLEVLIETDMEKLNQYNHDLSLLRKYRENIDNNTNFFSQEMLDERPYYTLVNEFIVNQQYTAEQIDEDAENTSNQTESAQLLVDSASLILQQDQERLSKFELYRQSIISGENQFADDDLDF